MTEPDTIESMVKELKDELQSLKSRQNVAANLAIFYDAEATSNTMDITVVAPAATIDPSSGIKRVRYTLDHAPAERPLTQPRLSWIASHGGFLLDINVDRSNTSPTSTSYIAVVRNYFADTALTISLKMRVRSSAPGTLTCVELP